MNPKNFLVALLLSLTAVNSQAWDDSGHLLIDQIAARKLRPEVIKKMESLFPLLDTRFNEGQAYNVVTAGLWLDDQRGLGKANPWSRWHYIDVPCAGDAFVEPPPPHALWALDQATAILRSKTAEPKDRAEALAQIMHIVGDIHQPLHTATHDDLGGNAVPIEPLGQVSAGPSNLHAFWDVACRYDVEGDQVTELWKNPNRLSRPHSVNEPGVIAERALILVSRLPQTSVTPPSSKQPWHEWARETHRIACKSAWPKEAPGKNIGGVQLTPAFIHASHEIAQEQVVKAGTRLAALLNELLGDEPQR